MSVWSERLDWLAGRQSIASIARTTGLPYRMLLRVRNGGDLPTGAASKLNPVYRSETYSAMTEAGTPTKIAASLRGGSLSRIVSTIRDFDARVKAFARGATLVHFAKTRLMLGQPEVKAYYDNATEKIRKALNKSEADRDTIFSDRYGKG